MCTGNCKVAGNGHFWMQLAQPPVVPAGFFSFGVVESDRLPFNGFHAWCLSAGISV